MRQSVYTACTTCLLIMLYAFLYCPMLLIVVSSFNASHYGTAWAGWTWHWYARIAEDPLFFDALTHSLGLAVSTTLLTLTVSTLLSFGLCYYRLWGRQQWRQLLLIMMIAPDLLLAIGYLVIARQCHWSLGFTSLWVGHVALCLPLTTLLIIQQFRTLPHTLFLAAQDLGANDWQLYRDVALPLLRPSLLSAGFLCFVISFDDTILSAFLTGPTFQTLPMYLLGAIKLGITPTLHAISTVILGASVLFILLASRPWRRHHVA